MKQDWVNSIKVQGYVFNHTLELRNSKKDGTPFIMGELNIATDDTATNIVAINFMYVTEKFSKSKKTNPTFPVLQSIMEENNTFELNGTSATRVRIDAKAEVNDFYTREGELASPKRVGGSFVHLLKPMEAIAENPASFDLDMLITNCATKEVEDGEDYLELSGYAFSFRGDLLPISLSVHQANGIKYFEGQDISQNTPLLTRVWGNIVSTTVQKKTVVESAFGEPSVTATTRTVRAWDVTGVSVDPMEFDDESTITKEELKTAMQQRQEYLADVKKRREEYEASKKNNNNAFSAKTTVASAVKTSPTADEDFPF